MKGRCRSANLPGDVGSVVLHNPPKSSILLKPLWGGVPTRTVSSPSGIGPEQRRSGNLPTSVDSTVITDQSYDRKPRNVWIAVDLWGRFGGGLESFEVPASPAQSRFPREFRSSPRQFLHDSVSHARGHRFESCSAHYFNLAKSLATTQGFTSIHNNAPGGGWPHRYASGLKIHLWIFRRSHLRSRNDKMADQEAKDCPSLPPNRFAWRYR
jgi:hypothetical protein